MSTNLKVASSLLKSAGVAEALGGVIVPSIWNHVNGKRISHVGALFIQRAGTQKAYYRIAMISNEGGAESKRTHVYTSGELVAYLEGVLDTVNRAIVIT